MRGEILVMLVPTFAVIYVFLSIGAAICGVTVWQLVTGRNPEREARERELQEWLDSNRH